MKILLATILVALLAVTPANAQAKKITVICTFRL
jgi:hypothetical protein